jgi:preprotein translocase subunit SecD
MSGNWWTRLLITAAIVAWGVLSLLPTARNWAAGSCPAWFPEPMCTRISLGLDLQGGLHLVLGVKIDQAVKDKIDVYGASMIADAAKENLNGVTLTRPQDQPFGATLTFASEADRAAFQSKVFANYDGQFLSVGETGPAITLVMKQEVIEDLRKSIFDQVVKTLENRVNEFGVKESSIARRGDQQILVELPGVQNDPKEVERRFGKAARLEFRLVDETARAMESYADALPPGIETGYDSAESGGTYAYLRASDRKTLEDFLQNTVRPALPVNLAVMVGEDSRGNNPADKSFRTYTLENKVLLTGDSIQNAGVAQDPEDGKPYVALEFDPSGAQTFADITGRAVRRRLAIVLDGFVSSAPVIRERIGGGRASITMGSMTGFDALLQEARDLAAVLRAGALPADVEILFRREVGASLGQDLIEVGRRALLIGALLVVVFMAIYYGVAGVIADIAVLLNVMLVLSIMAAFEATLTLPGMAGLVLLIGMAVDANVLINERIRDELKQGRGLKAAVETGYDKAFSAIFDSNLTTIIAAIILYQFGTGPVRGFAVTLSIGTICSMFTAIVVTRLIIDFLIGVVGVKRLSV